MQIILSIHFFFLERLISINLMTRIAQLMLMVQQETACRYPALLVIFLLIFNFHTIILVILAISKHSPKEKRPTK